MQIRELKNAKITRIIAQKYIKISKKLQINITNEKTKNENKKFKWSVLFIRLIIQDAPGSP